MRRIVARIRDPVLYAIDSLFAVVYPCECLVCGRFAPRILSASICESCWASIDTIKPPFCRKCGLPFTSEALTDGLDHVCEDCLFDSYVFDLARSACVFKGTAKEIVHLFKFEGRKNLGRRLARLLYETLVENGESFNAELILPVPLHKRRCQERGYNQSEVLARHLGKLCGLAVSSGNLVRIKPTPPQTGLTDKQRSDNVKCAFAIRDPRKIYGKKVLLLDDVMTTGATLNECSKTLLRAGAEAVYALTLARAVRR